MIGDSVNPEAQVYTDTSRVYDGLGHYESVNHSRGEYVRGDVHANGIEAFRALLKCGYDGTCHSMSRKHLHRYVNEFGGRYNSRGKSLLDRGHGTKQRLLWPLALRRSPETNVSVRPILGINLLSYWQILTAAWRPARHPGRVPRRSSCPGAACFRPNEAREAGRHRSPA